MTRDKNILLFLMLLIPLSVFALINVGYNQGRNYTNEYIIKFENYKRYIVNDTNIPFKYFEKSLTVDTSFKVGGFLNIEEFNISKNNTGDTYLFNGLKYWTMTNEGSEYYAISSNNAKKYSLHPQDSEIGVRVTEYVKEKTKVYGKGSFTNPWVFIKKYQVDLLSSNESLGSATPTSQVVSLSETAEFTISTANGYDFSVENCLARIDNNKVYIDNVRNDMTCNLEFTPKTYTLTYNNNGGSSCATKSITYGNAYGTLCTPSRSNYTFNGWFTAASGGSSVTSSTVATGDATIYAQWTPMNYTLTYDNNGGSGCTTKTVAYGSAYGTLCTPTRSNYTFLGWFTASSGGSSVTSSTVTSGNATIYAQWTPMNYTLTYDNNGGSGCTNKSVTYGSTYGTLCTPTRSNYTFNGWFNASSGGSSVTSSTVASGNATIYAQWTPMNYTLTYNNNGGSGCTSKTITYGSAYGTLCTPSRSYYTFLGWYTASSGGSSVTSSTVTSGNATIYAQWTPANYTLTYNNNGGSGCTSKTVTYGSAYGTLCTPSRSNHTFLGWYTASSGGSSVTSSTVTSGDATIYAQWLVNTCTITYAPGISATIANFPSSQTVNAGSYITISSLVPSTTSYGFNGWSYGGSTYAPNSSLGVCNGANYALTATWVTNAVARYPDVKVTVGGTTSNDYAYTSGSWGFKSVTSLNYQNQSSSHNVCEIDLNTSSSITLPSSGEVFKVKAYIYGATTYQIQWCTCTDPVSCCKSGDIASFTGGDGSYMENGTSYTKTNGYWGISGVSLGHQVSYSKSVSKYFRMRGVKGSTYSDWTAIYNSNWSRSSSTGNFSSYCN